MENRSKFVESPETYGRKIQNASRRATSQQTFGQIVESKQTENDEVINVYTGGRGSKTAQKNLKLQIKGHRGSQDKKQLAKYDGYFTNSNAALQKSSNELEEANFNTLPNQSVQNLHSKQEIIPEVAQAIQMQQHELQCFKDEVKSLMYQQKKRDQTRHKSMNVKKGGIKHPDTAESNQKWVNFHQQHIYHTCKDFKKRYEEAEDEVARLQRRLNETEIDQEKALQRQKEILTMELSEQFRLSYEQKLRDAQISYEELKNNYDSKCRELDEANRRHDEVMKIHVQKSEIQVTQLNDQIQLLMEKIETMKENHVDEMKTQKDQLTAMNNSLKQAHKQEMEREQQSYQNLIRIRDEREAELKESFERTLQKTEQNLKKRIQELEDKFQTAAKYLTCVHQLEVQLQSASGVIESLNEKLQQQQRHGTLQKQLFTNANQMYEDLLVQYNQKEEAIIQNLNSGEGAELQMNQDQAQR